MPQVRFEFHRGRPVDVSFDAPETSSDGGVLLLRQVDDVLGLTTRVAARVPDARDPRRVVHSRLEQVRQRIYSIALGYEDQNDATRLRHDRLLRVACDRAPDDARGLLSSQPSLSRVEHAVAARDVVRLQRELEADYVASLPDATSIVVLDIDATDDPTHGQQPLSFFHGHYDQHMYFPLVVTDHEGRLASVRLRPGNAGNNRYATPLLVRLVRAIKRRFPAAQVVVRADAGFCTPRLLDALEILDADLGDVDYVIGLERNVRLLASVEQELEQAASRAHAGQPARVFTSFWYEAGRWRHARYVVAKAEHLGDKPNPRFVVTSLDYVSPRMLYERGYCGRGDAENRIKDFKRALAADRLSCTTYVANAFRLLLHAFAYRLMDALRRELAIVAPVLARAQFDTLRLKLFKVAACVRASVRRTTVALPRAFPCSDVFARLAVALGATTSRAPTVTMAAA